jgi:hypothetical protein
MVSFYFFLKRKFFIRLKKNKILVGIILELTMAMILDQNCMLQN